jgi:hypothetical protein
MVLRFHGTSNPEILGIRACQEANPLELRLNIFEASDWPLDRKLK